MMASPGIRFDDYEFDSSTRELYRSGARVKLQDLPLRLLAVLLEQPGQLVSREELQQRLWAGTGFLDFEDGLNTAIRKLRQALEDDPARPRYVETVRGRGYRWLAPVTADEPAGRAPASSAGDASPAAAVPGVPGTPAIAVAPPPSLPPARPHPRPAHAWIPAASVLLALALAFAVWWFNPLPPPQLLRATRITTSGRMDNPTRLTTDGTRIFFLARFGDRWQLMQTSLSGGGSRPFPMPFRNATIMDVSPDRAWFLVGSFQQRGTEMPLWRIPTQGGAPMRLGHLVAADAVYSHGGHRIAFGHRHGIWLARADGSQPRRLTHLPGFPGDLSWSPHDRRLRFTLDDPLHATSSIWEIGSSGRHPHPLLPDWDRAPQDCCGSWTPDGRYFLFTSAHAGQFGLWALREHDPTWRRAPRGPFQLTAGPVSAFQTLVAPDNRRVFFYGGRHEDQMVEWNLHDGTYTPFLPALNPAEVAFARNGKAIAWVNATSQLWIARADGSHRRRLTPNRPTLWFPRWSPLGNRLALTAQYAGHNAMVYLVALDGSPPRPLAPRLTDVRDGDWSPHGRHLVFTYLTNPSSARLPMALALAALPSRRITPLPGSAGLIGPRWSPAGGYLAALGENQHRLMLYDFAQRRWQLVARGRCLGLPVWSPHGRSLYFQDLLASGEPLYRLPVPFTGPARKVAGFSSLLQSGIIRTALIGITPDGQPLLSLTHSNTDIYAADLRLP